MLVWIQFTICPLNDYLETTRNRPPTDNSLYYQISSKHGLRIQYVLSLRTNKKLAPSRLVNEFNWSLDGYPERPSYNICNELQPFIPLYSKALYTQYQEMRRERVIMVSRIGGIYPVKFVQFQGIPTLERKDLSARLAIIL